MHIPVLPFKNLKLAFAMNKDVQNMNYVKKLNFI